MQLWLTEMFTFDISDKIIKTKYIKRKINVLLMSFITLIIRLLICSLLCMIFTYNQYVDFFLHSGISIVLCINTNNIYKIVENKNQYFYSITRYCINNYSNENYRRWKRNVTVSVSFLIIIYLLLIEITNTIMMIYIIQYLLIYFIVDIIDNNKFSNIVENIKQKQFTVLHDKLTIIDKYYNSNIDVDVNVGKDVKNMDVNVNDDNCNNLLIEYNIIDEDYISDGCDGDGRCDDKCDDKCDDGDDSDDKIGSGITRSVYDSDSYTESDSDSSSIYIDDFDDNQQIKIDNPNIINNFY